MSNIRFAQSATSRVQTLPIIWMMSAMAVIPDGETWRFYYFAGASRVAMRTATSTTSSLVYFLGDHLGSTSITVNPDGSKMAEMRYTAWGETRYTDGVTPTDYQYTGQRNESAIGLYYYNARWYDPYITHFNQPDSIVPDPYNPQAYNRYAYALNNPIRYNDPSGHETCMDDFYWDGQCHDEATYLKKTIEENYLWYLEGEWDLDELLVIFQVAYDIELFANGLTGGDGLEWMLHALGNTTIVHRISEGKSDALPLLGNNFGPRIRLYDGWLNDWWGPKQLLAHELGHVWDINSMFYASLQMNVDLGGVGVCLICKPGKNVPQWDASIHPDHGDAYGNSGRNEYFAEAFALTVYDRANTPNGVSGWIDEQISNPSYFLLGGLGGY
jgi:RHS repeat-associated protein